MGKIIIQNETNLPEQMILRYIINVISRGRISKTGKGEQYCFLTVFEYPPKRQIHVASFLNKKSDRFVIYESKKGNKNGK